MTGAATFEVVADPSAVAARAADRFVEAVREAARARGRALVCLAGGSTPRAAYRLLSESSRMRQVPWDAVELYFGDERSVPPDDAASNFRMVNENLVARVPIAAERVHRIRGEDDPEDAARAYEGELRRAEGVEATGAPPRFDLVFLGMGADGHTASLFPGDPALDETGRWAVGVVRPDGLRGVTLTLPVFAAAHRVVFLATGTEKRKAFAAVRSPGRDPLPAARVRPRDGTLTWIVDAALARP